MAERARAQERRVGADARQLEERGPDSADASLSGIEEFSRLGEKIDRRRFDILRTIRSGLSNARLEAVCVCSIEVRPMQRNYSVRKSGRN